LSNSPWSKGKKKRGLGAEDYERIWNSGIMEKPCYGLQVTSKKTKVQGPRIKEKGKG